MVIIGLDCAEPSLVFGDFLPRMPNVKKLMDGGIWGKMRSTDPPITVPAWTSMLTSKDPGELGVYGFRNRADYTYKGLYFANDDYIKEKRVWNYLARKRIESFALSVPQTYPPKPMRGILVGDFLTPDKNAVWTYPSEAAHEIDALADGDYIIDVKDFRTDNKDWLVEQVYNMTERRFKVFREFVRRGDHQFCMMVEMGVDRLHHGFWRYHDKTHRLYEPGNKYEFVIRDYYQYLDARIGDILQVVDRDTAVMLVSDHGAKGMAGAICVNEWLMQKGYLALKQPVTAPSKMKMDMIDWSQTYAWGEGGYYSRIFFNVKGREPEGIIEPADYPQFRDRIQRDFEAIDDETGKNIGTVVLRPEQIYRKVNNVPPDLIVYFGNLDWRSAGQIGTGAIHIFENDTGPDDANHAPHAMLVLTLPGGRKAQALAEYSIYDIAPTILDYFDVEIPADMIGKSIL
jgi:predicted AlkP superfamily phosphohydrolase/phosphomutase